MDSQVDGSQRKFAKPELAYGLVMGGQTDSQVDSQVAKSHKFHAYTVNLCRLVLGGQMVKTCVNLRMNLSSTKVNASHHKSTQVGCQTKHKLIASRKLVSTCIDLRVRLARTLDDLK